MGDDTTNITPSNLTPSQQEAANVALVEALKSATGEEARALLSAAVAMGEPVLSREQDRQQEGQAAEHGATTTSVTPVAAEAEITTTHSVAADLAPTAATTTLLSANQEETPLQESPEKLAEQAREPEVPTASRQTEKASQEDTKEKFVKAVADRVAQTDGRPADIDLAKGAAEQIAQGASPEQLEKGTERIKARATEGVTPEQSEQMDATMKDVAALGDAIRQEINGVGAALGEMAATMKASMENYGTGKFTPLVQNSTTPGNAAGGQITATPQRGTA